MGYNDNNKDRNNRDIKIKDNLNNLKALLNNDAMNNSEIENFNTDNIINNSLQDIEVTYKKFDYGNFDIKELVSESYPFLISGSIFNQYCAKTGALIGSKPISELKALAYGANDEIDALRILNKVAVKNYSFITVWNKQGCIHSMLERFKHNPTLLAYLVGGMQFIKPAKNLIELERKALAFKELERVFEHDSFNADKIYNRILTIQLVYFKAFGKFDNILNKLNLSSYESFIVSLRNLYYNTLKIAKAFALQFNFVYGSQETPINIILKTNAKRERDKARNKHLVTSAKSYVNNIINNIVLINSEIEKGEIKSFNFDSAFSDEINYNDALAHSISESDIVEAQEWLEDIETDISALFEPLEYEYDEEEEKAYELGESSKVMKIANSDNNKIDDFNFIDIELDSAFNDAMDNSAQKHKKKYNLRTQDNSKAAALNNIFTDRDIKELQQELKHYKPKIINSKLEMVSKNNGSIKDINNAVINKLSFTDAKDAKDVQDKVKYRDIKNASLKNNNKSKFPNVKLVNLFKD